jgi:hypothetical protein
MATHRALFDALRAHDAAALSALYAADASVDLGPGLGAAHGPDEVAALARRLFAAFPDSKAQWGKALQSGDAIAVELGWTGTEQGTKKVVGTAALVVERFAPDGRIRSQHVCLAADALAADIATRAGKPHPFAGLPTMQTSVPDGAVAGARDGSEASLMLESFADGRHLALANDADASSAWVDLVSGRTRTGIEAVRAWLASVRVAFPGAGQQIAKGWVAGAWAVEELAVMPAAAASPDALREIDLVRFEGGRIAEVRSCRSGSKAGESAAGRRRGPASR